MSSTSKKHRDFVREPIGNKCVHDLPGIGGAYGHRLNNSGYGSARQVVGQYLVQGGSEPAFRDFLRSEGGVNNKSSGDCYRAVRDWTDNHM
ncbi:hypothetical protein Trydic_g2638 [Trypoxylus dichotomus]